MPPFYAVELRHHHTGNFYRAPRSMGNWLQQIIGSTRAFADISGRTPPDETA